MGNFIRTNFVFQDMNWNAVCNGGLTVGAMAIADARPEDAFYTMQNALRSLEYMMPEFLPDGGWVEGPGYWEYMMEYMAYMVEAMKYPLGTDFNIMSYKGMSQTAYYMYSMYGNAGTNNYHDAGVSKTLPVQLFWLGKTLKDPGVTAARLLTMRQLNQTGDHWDCLWYDTAVTGEKVYLPLDVYSRNEETGAMRSSWEDKQGMYISYNGGRNNVNHYHLDAGTFVLDMFGERWAADLGSEDLTYSVSFSGGRDNVYRVRPEGHNTLVINPSSDAGQSRTADCKVRRVESKPRGALQVLDLTPAYESQVNSARRGFLLTDDRRTFVVRDELSLKQESEVYWFMHTPADIEITGSRSAMLSIGGKRMKFDFDTDAEEAELSVMAAEPLPTSPKIAGQNSNAGYQKLAIRVKAKEKVQISARLTPADEASAQTAFRCDNIADWSIPEGELQTLPQCDALYADGKAIEGFSPEQGSYVVKLPHDYQRLPEITAESQSGTVQYLRKAATPEDSCEIRVTAQNGSYRSYFVAFRVLPEFGAVGGYQRYSPQDIAASENPEPENRDVNAVDADLNTRWSADGEQWLRCDLGEAKSVDAFAVAFMRGDGRKYSFRVEVSEDGKSYTPVFEGLSSGTTTDYELYEIPRVQARFIRYYGMGNNENTWNSVTEFAVLTKGAES